MSNEGDHLSQRTLRDLEKEFERVEKSSHNELAPPVQMGSSLAEDDKRTDPYQMTTMVAISLNAAADHISALRSTIIKGEGVHPWASYTLLRAALENAATSVWLLEPSTRRSERIKRLLRLHYTNAHDRNKAVATAGGAGDLSEQKDKFISIGRDAGLDQHEIDEVSKRVSWGNVVQGAESSKHIQLSNNEAFLIWQVCSAVAHARPWGTLSALDHEVATQKTNGMMQVRLTTSEELLLSSTQVAAHFIEVGWHLYNQRRIRH